MVFRDNESTRVGAVTAAKAAGDRAAMVAGALALWLEPPERPGPDAAAAEVWEVLRAAKLVDEARAAALPALREGRAIRAHAYIDLIESIENRPLLLELADVALAKSLAVTPYLASICFALVDAGAEDVLWPWIKANDAALRATTDRWVLVAVLLTTSRMGDRHDLAAWFTGFEARPDVPMWIVCAHLCARRQTGVPVTELGAEAERALASARRDVTIGFPLAIQLVRHARAKEMDAFAALVARDGEAVAWPAPDANPLVLYVNRSKHARAVGVADLTFDFEQFEARGTGGLVRVALTADNTRPPNWRIGLLVKEPAFWIDRVGALAPYFARMSALPVNDPGVIPLYRAWQREKPSAVPAFSVAFDALLKTKLSFWKRMKLNYF